LNIKLYTKKFFVAGFFIFGLLLHVATLLGQSPDSLMVNIGDSLSLSRDRFPVADSLSPDSLSVQRDSVRLSPDAIKDIVDFSATDSVYIDLDTKMVYMFREAKVHYTDIDLSSGYIEVDLEKNELLARGIPDSTGKIAGNPDFKSGETGFVSKEMHYNFKTKKGVVENIKTSDDQGTILAQRVKKYEDNSANLLNGSYSTCELDHPHFALKFKKARQIPDDKIVTGPAYLEVEGLPLPLVLPFGYFPNNKKHKSGIIIPTYGESPTLGFFFKGGGFYWYINEYMDIKLTGDIYTLGSWAINPVFRYKKRYSYNGNLRLGYAVNIIGEKGEPDYKKHPDFSIQWTHSQDPKANPNGRFSANVNIRTSGFNKYNSNNTDNYLKSSFQSSINYSTTIAKRFRLSISANHMQNMQTKQMTITLPNLNLSMDKFFPFRQKERTGKIRWFENIGLTYSMNAQGKVTSYDSLFLSPAMWENYQKGARHKVTLDFGTIKLLKYIKWTNSANYNENWYPEKTLYRWNDTSTVVGSGGYLDTISDVSGFYSQRDFSASSSINTTIYGMYVFSKGPVKALRHVVTPSVSLRYHPDFTTDFWGYYAHYVDSAGKEKQYYLYDNQLFASNPGMESGNINISISQNLEMKVRSREDTISGMKKIKLIDNLRVSTSYDMAKDSLNWSGLNVSANTKLFKRITLTYSGNFDPYAVDTTGARINVFQWELDKQLLRPLKHQWKMGFNYRLDQGLFSSKKEKTNNDKKAKSGQSLLKWNMSINYNIAYTQVLKYYRNSRDYMITKEPELIHAIDLSGNFVPSPNWKVDFRTNFDLENEQITYTEIGVYRDLHCWEMSFKWVPSGYRKSYMFSIRIKASMLKDIKWEKKSDFRDNGF
jgi:lipopolysaccharide assembly outer membrane protein LptD (OstA)